MGRKPTQPALAGRRSAHDASKPLWEGSSASAHRVTAAVRMAGGSCHAAWARPRSHVAIGTEGGPTRPALPAALARIALWLSVWRRAHRERGACGRGAGAEGAGSVRRRVGGARDALRLPGSVGGGPTRRATAPAGASRAASSPRDAPAGGESAGEGGRRPWPELCCPLCQVRCLRSGKHCSAVVPLCGRINTRRCSAPLGC